ncbi:MAG: DUF1640 domain-containing protein [Methylococcales bacterium]|nr:DUF1640 domain-containing protein [Methylococcales bacterium]
MTTIPFDTLDFSTELIESGLPEKQANAIAKAVSKAQQNSMTTVIEQVKHDHDMDNLTTKRDLKETELRLEARIKETELKIELVKSELKRDIETLRKEAAENKAALIRWVMGVGLLQITIITALLLKLVGHI